MRSIVIYSANDLRLERDDAVPEISRNQVLVRIEVGGVCGTDLHYFNHGGFGSVRLREPMILGHEVAGRIEEMGQDVVGLEVGELVAVLPSRPCRACHYCLDGLPNHCENMRFYGSAMPFPHIQGAFRDWLVVEPVQCVSASSLTPDQAAFAEPLSVCLHAVRQAGDILGKRVLITGCGPIGALMVLVLRRSGAEKIIVTDLTEFPLSLASRLGADETINMSSSPRGLEAYQNGKGQLHLHFECSGAASALAAGISALMPRGTVVQLGLGGEMKVPMQALTAKELTMKGSFRFHNEFVTAVELMSKGLIDTGLLHTHTFGLDRAVEAFQMAGDRSRAMKVQLAFK